MGPGDGLGQPRRAGPRPPAGRLMSSGQAHVAYGTDNAGPPPQVMVAADGIRRTFGSGHLAVQALRGVSLTVDRGQLVALRGRSGSGKTTLLNIIGGLDDPTAGRVWVDGREVNRMTERQRLALRRGRGALHFPALRAGPDAVRGGKRGDPAAHRGSAAE